MAAYVTWSPPKMRQTWTPLVLRLSELQDENDPNDFNLPEDGPRYGAATKGEQHLDLAPSNNIHNLGFW